MVIGDTSATRRREAPGVPADPDLARSEQPKDLRRFAMAWLSLDSPLLVDRGGGAMPDPASRTMAVAAAGRVARVRIDLHQLAQRPTYPLTSRPDRGLSPRQG